MTVARWYELEADGKVRCTLCPRRCSMAPGQRGFCYVRRATETGMELTTYGRSSGFCIDPIEKKPLNHFLPGTAVLSFGTAGCNLGCRFCQNWDISKARQMDRLQDTAMPVDIAAAARAQGCRSIAFTYNDPVIFAEYAIDTAAAAHEAGLYSVAVTAGYIEPGAREEFFAAMDATNIDLKAFSEEFYKKLCFAHLGEVLETIEYVCNETDTWVELTTLLIPGENDSEAEVDALTKWIVERVGPDVPLHFSAFHPDFKLTKHPKTPISTLRRARRQALDNGLRYVYTGNVHDPAGASTWCPSCGALLVERDWYDLGHYGLEDGACRACGHVVPGLFEGRPGSWGRQRRPVAIGEHS